MKKIKLYSFAVIGLIGLNLNFNSDLRLKMASPDGTPNRIRDKIEQRVENKMEKRIENFKNTQVNLHNIKIIAKDTTSITIENNSTNVKINISDKTQLRRRFWGKSELAEFSVNNMVDIIGKWTDDTKTAIDARLVRNLSIQKRYGVFFGEVKNISGDNFVITTIHRDDETVTIGSAKLINRKGETISKTDILVGHKVRVMGMWDNANKTITEVKEIKDFSLPVRPSPSPKSN